MLVERKLRKTLKMTTNSKRFIALLLLATTTSSVVAFQVPLLQRQRPVSTKTRTRLYSTTEESKTTEDDAVTLDENSLFNDDEQKTAHCSMPPLEDFLKDDKKDWRRDYVMVNDEATRQNMEQDKVMRLVTSEVRVWKQLRGNNANPGLPIDVVIERTWDTVEDVLVHLRRKAYEQGAAVLTPEEDASRKTVVILGSGWAAHALMKGKSTTRRRFASQAI